MRLLWLPDELSDAGLDVNRVGGWETRGSAIGFDPRVIVDHNTGGALGSPHPSLRIITHGRKGIHPVPSPLANILTGRDGTVHVVAAGRSNNAGRGGWPPYRATSNRHTIGHEIEHTGNLATEPINQHQLDVAAQTDAVICRHYGWHSSRCVGHAEWAPGRKVDPVWSQAEHRDRVARMIANAAPTAGADDDSMTDLATRITAARALIHDAYRLTAGRAPTVEAEQFWYRKADVAARADTINGDIESSAVVTLISALTRMLETES